MIIERNGDSLRALLSAIDVELEFTRSPICPNKFSTTIHGKEHKKMGRSIGFISHIFYMSWLTCSSI